MEPLYKLKEKWSLLEKMTEITTGMTEEKIATGTEIMTEAEIGREDQGLKNIDEMEIRF